MLISKGYEMSLDGLFKEKTFQAIKEFQLKNDLFPSGKVNKNTLLKLVK